MLTRPCKGGDAHIEYLSRRYSPGADGSRHEGARSAAAVHRAIREPRGGVQAVSPLPEWT